MVDLGTATQRLGGNLDWFRHRVRISVEGVGARVVLGTDVKLALGPVSNDTLGIRLELPTRIGPEELPPAARFRH